MDTPKPTLLSFCLAAARELEATFSIRRFMELRYEELADLFPHPVFSVHEATPDFFTRTIRYLRGEDMLPSRATLGRGLSQYEQAYVDWVRRAMV